LIKPVSSLFGGLFEKIFLVPSVCYALFISRHALGMTEQQAVAR